MRMRPFGLAAALPPPAPRGPVPRDRSRVRALHHASPPSVAGIGGTDTSPPHVAAWIDSYELRYGTPTEDQFRALNAPPPPAVAPQRNHSPSDSQRRVSRDGFVYQNHAALGLDGGKRPRARIRRFLMRKTGAERGRKWDHLRSAEPVIVPRYRGTTADSPWHSYLASSRYGRMPNEEAQLVDIEVLNKLQPGFNSPPGPCRLRDEDGRQQTAQARTNVLYKRLWRVILQHPLVPLAFRLIVLLTSIVALALSVRIFELERGGNSRHSAELTQAIVAIVVDTVAVPYIGYMTWDEYTGKPLGLRPATQKISLVLMDLFFIIFKSASTALAFEALVFHNSGDRQTRQLSRALAAFQLVSLISWSFTFTVNVFRLVQKLGGGDDERGR